MSRNIAPVVVLASASPWRKKLLKEVFPRFAVMKPRVPEERLIRRWKKLPPREVARRLAFEKARAVARKKKRGVVIAADTFAVAQGKILGKPRDDAHARRILKMISGRTHDLISGLAVMDLDGGRVALETVVTRLTMRKMLDEEIEAYVASGEPRGKSGAYSIQENGDRFVTKMTGSFSNVVGLPLERLRTILRRWKIPHLAGNRT